MVDGASRWQVFRYLTLPAILPVSVTLVLIRVIEAFKIVDLPNVLTNGGPGIASEVPDAARLHGLARARSRRLGGDGLHPAVRGHLLLRLVRQPRPAPGWPGVTARAAARGCARSTSPRRSGRPCPTSCWASGRSSSCSRSTGSRSPRSSCRSTSTTARSTCPVIDFQPSLDAWRYLFGTMLGDTLRPYLNTVIVASCSSVIAVAIGSMAAYALVRLTYRPRLGAILGFVALRRRWRSSPWSPWACPGP